MGNPNRPRRSITSTSANPLSVAYARMRSRCASRPKPLSVCSCVLLDSNNQTFDAWGVKTLPTSFLIDAEGRPRYKIQGNPGWNNEHTLRQINALLATPDADTAP